MLAMRADGRYAYAHTQTKDVTVVEMATGKSMGTIAGPERRVHIRQARAADGAQLLELTRECPMRGAISLAIEREPDFFALSRARGRARTLVAESQGRIVGCVGVARRAAWVDGRDGEVAYLADLKVAPQLRGSGLGSCLVAAALEPDGPARPLLASVASGNRPVERLAKRYTAPAGLRDAVGVSCLQLFAARSAARSGFEIERARPEDEDELASLLDGFYRERQFAPVFGAGGLRAILDCSPGLELRDYLVVRRGGRIVATVAVWNQDGFKRVRVLHVGQALRIALAALNLAARVSPLPAIPTRGELRLAFLRHPACVPGAERELGALLQAATREAAIRGRHFAVLTVSQGDPVGRAARGIPRLRYRYRLLIGGQGGAAAQPGGRVVFDDAALS